MPKKKKKGFLKAILILILMILIGCGGFTMYSLSPVGQGSKEVSFKVKQGQSYSSVLQELEDNHLIRNRTVAYLYAKLTHKDTYYAGEFTLNDGMNTPMILEHLGDVNHAQSEQVTITVPEGKWAKEIAAMIHEKYPQYKTEEIIAYWNDQKTIEMLAKDYAFLNPKELNNKNYRVKLEGYLFPETYSFDTDASLETITRTFLNKFDEVYKKYKKDIDKSGYTVHEIVSLASVVQFEAGSVDDMKTIAGVFYNRLDQDMKLQSSVTVCYALYDDFEDPQDCEVNTEMESPYNTYLEEGLPIGPILNPGMEAIDAVLHPQDTEYLFFAADPETGKVYYSKTYEEHEEIMEQHNLYLD